MASLLARQLFRGARPLPLITRCFTTSPTAFRPPPNPQSSSDKPNDGESPNPEDQQPTSGFTPNPPSGPGVDGPSTPTPESPLPLETPDSKVSPSSLPSLDITSTSELSTSLPRSSSEGSAASRQRTGAKAASTQTSIDRQRRMLVRIWTGLMVAGAVGGIVWMGREWDADEKRAGLHDGTPDTWMGRFRRRVSEMLDYYNKPQWKELLPPPLPYPHGRPYTLVIDIDDLLVASTWDRQHGWRTAKRPGVDYFLAYLSQFYEVVVFTTQYVYSAQPVLESLDPFSAFINYRLFRESCRMNKGQIVKDLSYLNRDLSKVIMIDTDPGCASLQPENAIILPKWDGKPGDKGLVGLIPFLESIAIHRVPDVRPILEKYAGKDIPAEYAKIEAEQKRLAIEEWEKTHAGSAGSMGRFTLSSIFGGPSVLPPSPNMPTSYLEQKREEAQKIYMEEQRYFREQGDNLRRMIEEDRERQLKEMRGSLFGYLGLGPPKQAGELGDGPGVAGAPIGQGSTGQTPPVVGSAASAGGKSS